LATYAIGLGATLLAVSLLGGRLIRRLDWLADPEGWVRRVLALAFVLIGTAILFGLDHDLQAWILEHSPIRPWEAYQGFIPDG